jgi:photosystem II stability/assembly factor-like uncharacterized protein
MFKRIVAVLTLGFLLNACDGQSGDESPGSLAPHYRPDVFNAKWMAGMLDPVSKAFFLVGQQGSILRSEDGFDWVYADTPVIHQLNRIEGDEKSGFLVSVGDAGTILRSVDGGQTWLQAEIKLPASVDWTKTELKAVIHHPAKDVWLAAGTQNAIVRSVDRGKSWDLLSYDSSTKQLEILALFVERETGDVLFAAQHGTMGRSGDGGASWDISYHDMEVEEGSYVPHLVDFYQYEDVLIAAADLGRLLISKDGGKNWQLTKIPTSGYFTGSAFDPVHHAIILATQEGDEIAYSQDSGKSWQLQNLKIGNWPGNDLPKLSAITYDAKTGSLLTLGNSGIIARSGNGGQSWQGNLLKPLFNLSVTTLLHDPEHSVFVIAGLGGVILTARGLMPDLVTGWKVVRPGIDLYMREVINIPGSDTFVSVGQLGGIWRSEDDGRNWSFIEPKYPYQNQPPHFRDLIIDPMTQALIAAGPDGSIIRSTDAGKTWTPVFQGVITLGEAFTKILIDEKNKTLIACEALYQSVYMSRNGGADWEKVTVIPTDGRTIWHGAVSEKLGLIMITGQKGLVGVSRDGGYTWEIANSGTNEDLYGAFADEESGALFAVGDKGMILRSENGRQWQSVTSGTRSTLRRMSIEPKAGALLAFGQGGTILRSEDRGKKWSWARSPVLDSELRKALIEPGSNNVIIVGRDGVVLRSEDAGSSWQLIPSHTTQHFRSAGFNPVTGTLILVGDGLVRLSRDK